VRKSKRELEDLARFVLGSFGSSDLRFRIHCYDSESYQSFVIGQQLFCLLGEDSPEGYKEMEEREVREYGRPVGFEEHLWNEYGTCLLVDNKSLIPQWCSVFERQIHLYPPSWLPHLRIFFRHIRELLKLDFVILLDVEFLESMSRKDKTDMVSIALIEETLHGLEGMGRKPPSSHDEILQLARAILDRYDSCRGH